MLKGTSTFSVLQRRRPYIEPPELSLRMHCPLRLRSGQSSGNVIDLAALEGQVAVGVVAETINRLRVQPRLTPLLSSSCKSFAKIVV